MLPSTSDAVDGACRARRSGLTRPLAANTEQVLIVDVSARTPSVPRVGFPWNGVTLFLCHGSRRTLDDTTGRG